VWWRKTAAGGDDGDGAGTATSAAANNLLLPSATPRQLRSLCLHLDVLHALASAFIVLRRGSDVWVTVAFAANSFGNTVILLASSFTLETARRRLTFPDPSGFRKLWLLHYGLGILFVADS